MSVPNPAPHGVAGASRVVNPAPRPAPPTAQQSTAFPAAPPPALTKAAPRPPLTKAAARRARLAGGLGGGLTWLGLGILQLCAVFLLLPVIVAAVVTGIGFAVAQDGSSATAGAWSQTLEWLGSPWGIAIAIGIPAGLVIALLGLWLSARILRHPGIRRPIGVTFAGFGIAVGATVLLSSAGSLSLPFFGGLPLGGLDLGVDADSLRPGASEEEIQRWFLDGGVTVLEGLAHPATLLGVLGPWIAAAQMLALVVPIALSVFSWWWMANAMRPAATGTAAAAPAEAPAGAPANA